MGMNVIKQFVSQLIGTLTHTRAGTRAPKSKGDHGARGWYEAK